MGTAPIQRLRPTGVAELERMVQVEIVPRLLLARRNDGVQPRRSGPPPGAMAGPEQIAELTRVVLTRSDETAFAYVDSVRTRGMAIDRIYLDLISPVARHLGDMWLADTCSFTDVTAGLWRLQHVVRSMSPRFQLDAPRGQSQHHALLVPLPGEQHTFGLYMVAEFFRRSGWNVSSMPLQTADELTTIVRGEWFSLIGFSLSCDSRLDELARFIRAIRRVSCNHGIGVMVGGNIFIDHPELVAQVGADMMAVDGRQAPAKANELVNALAAVQ